MLFKAISDMQIKICDCIALSNALIEEQNMLVYDDNGVYCQELSKLLTQKYERLEVIE
jgi:hypothetical protein